MPTEGSVADSAPIGGTMVLFKLTLNSLANRPLELRITSPEPPQTEAVVDLDVSSRRAGLYRTAKSAPGAGLGSDPH